MPPRELTPAQITTQALSGKCPLCMQAVEVFCAALGVAAGNLAVILGALGGVYIGGRIVPRLGMLFERSAFRARFEAKGRFRTYLASQVDRAQDVPDRRCYGVRRKLGNKSRFSALMPNECA